MSYTEVAPADLVVGREYVLTRKGIKPRVNEGLTYEVRNVPAYKTYDPSRPAPTVKATVAKKPETLVIPPTSKKALEDAYRALLAYKKRDAPFSERQPTYGWEKKPKYEAFVETDYRKRAFFAGRRNVNTLVFSQERSFGSKKASPEAFKAVNVNEKTGHYGALLHNGLSADEWAFWEQRGNNGTRRNNNAASRNNGTKRNNAAARNNGTRRNRRNNAPNVPTGNLLGLNKPAAAPVNMRSANQALNNVSKKHMLEQNLKGIFNSK